MYSIEAEKKQVDRINNYIQHNTSATIMEIARDCITNWHRLKYLESNGLIKLPNPTPYGERNGKFRKVT